MKNAFWTYWLILLGVFIVVIMLLVQSVTTNNQQDYFLIKELTEAAMVDAVDFAYYRQYGEIKMNKEKFYEIFIRRFAENAQLTNSYEISFYDVYEAPPKASVEISGKSGTFSVVGDSTEFDIVNRIDAIIEGSVLGPNAGKNTGSGSSSTGSGSGSSSSSTGTGSGSGSTGSGNSSTGTGSGSSSGTGTGTGTGTGSGNSSTGTGSGSGSSNTGSGSTGTESNSGIEANKLNVKDNSNNNVTAEVVVTSEKKIKKYYFSEDDGATWVESDSNSYTFKNVSSGEHKLRAYAIDVDGNKSNEVENTVRVVANNDSCLEDPDFIADTSLAGMRGTPMVKETLYRVFSGENESGKLSAGKIFTILGSRVSTYTNIEYWAIKIEETGKCGWIKANNMAISLVDYAPEIKTDIKNAYSAIYKSSGYDIPGITGRQLYSSVYRDFVPVIYGFAKELKTAARNAARGGDTLVVMDAYRPRSVTLAGSRQFSTIVNKPAVLKGMDGWGQGWFLASSLSTHNVGCAVDITLEGGNMPSAMHELSNKAAVFTSQSKTTRIKGWSGSDAEKLMKYMTGAGLDYLASEWWHFQDTNCYNRLKKATGGVGANFWSAI